MHSDYKKIDLESNFCAELKLPLKDLIPTIYYEVNNNFYYDSPTNQIRADASENLREELNKLIGIPFYCCGFHKNSPQWHYKLHIDSIRQCAINILLTEESEEFDASVFVPNYGMVQIPYRTNVPLLLNTKKLHYVKNNSKTKIRHIMTIGFDKYNYSQVKEIMSSKY